MKKEKRLNRGERGEGYRGGFDFHDRVLSSEYKVTRPSKAQEKSLVFVNNLVFAPHLCALCISVICVPDGELMNSLVSSPLCKLFSALMP